MLKKLRNKKTAKRIWVILALIIVPAFVLWGSGSVMRSREEVTYAGTIFGRRISLLEYKDALEATRNQAIMQFGERLSDVQKYLNLESQAWDRLILLMEARRRKINAGDKEVVKLIESYPFFQNKGRFDNKLYAQMLQYEFRVQPRVFEEQLRQNLVLYKLYKEVTEGVGVTEEAIKEEYQKANEEISVDYIVSSPAQFLKDIVPSQEQVKDYFTKDPLQFKQPLSFNVEYLSLPREGANEKAVKEKIRSLLSGIKKEGMVKVAQDHKLAIKETGLFTQIEPIPGIGWSPQIMNLIFKLRTGETLPPIQMDKYYYIIRLKERKEPYIPDFETIKEKVKESFIKYKSRETAKEKIDTCLKRLQEAARKNPNKTPDFARAAKEFGLKADSTALFKYSGYIDGIGASDNFWVAAQHLKADEISGIINVPSGFYIIKLKSRIPVNETRFKEEKADFSQKLLVQKKTEYFAKFTEELRKKSQIVNLGISLP